MCSSLISLLDHCSRKTSNEQHRSCWCICHQDIGRAVVMINWCALFEGHTNPKGGVVLRANTNQTRMKLLLRALDLLCSFFFANCLIIATVLIIIEGTTKPSQIFFMDIHSEHRQSIHQGGHHLRDCLSQWLERLCRAVWALNRFIRQCDWHKMRTFTVSCHCEWLKQNTRV